MRGQVKQRLSKTGFYYLDQNPDICPVPLRNDHVYVSEYACGSVDFRVFVGGLRLVIPTYEVGRELQHTWCKGAHVRARIASCEARAIL